MWCVSISEISKKQTNFLYTFQTQKKIHSTLQAFVKQLLTILLNDVTQTWIQVLDTNMCLIRVGLSLPGLISPCILRILGGSYPYTHVRHGVLQEK